MKLSRFIPATRFCKFCTSERCNSAPSVPNCSLLFKCCDRIRRFSKMACERVLLPESFAPSGCISKYSKFLQQSKTLKKTLSSLGPNKSSQSLVPRPSIWRNFTLDFITLKNIRLTTSGTSTPVSSMSTETAMESGQLGSAGFFSPLNSSISESAYFSL